MYQFNIKKWLTAGVLAAVMMSCKKDMPAEIYPASLTIVNGINDNSSILNVYFGATQPKVYSRLAYIASGAYWEYGTDKMQQPVTLYRNYDTLAHSTPFLKTVLELEPGGIFTHFVYGSATQVKQKTVKEHLPSRSLSDSVANLRIINLFDNRNIDVVQLEPEARTMVTDLAYEQLSDFIRVPVTMAVQNFRFEIRDHATGATLTTLTDVNIPPGSTEPNRIWLFRARTMLVTGTWTSAGVFSARAKTISHY